MFNLFTDLLMGPDFRDIDNISKLLRIQSSEIANSFIEDSLSYALSYASSGISEMRYNNEKLTNSRLLCNYAIECLKTSNPKLILDDLINKLE